MIYDLMYQLRERMIRVRHKKECDARTFRLRKDLADKIDRYSEITFLSKTAIVEKALDMYFKANENDSAAEPSVRNT